MDAQIMTEYQKIRTPYYAFFAGTGAHYQHQVTAEQALKLARYHVKVNTIWNAHAESDVRLQIEPDDSADIDFLMGDSFDPEVNPEINPSKLSKEKEAFINRLDRDGVWGIVGQYKCKACGHWLTADSVWGFVGDDWQESGYDLDVKASTLDAAGFWPQDKE